MPSLALNFLRFEKLLDSGFSRVAVVRSGGGMEMGGRVSSNWGSGIKFPIGEQPEGELLLEFALGLLATALFQN